MENSFCHTGTHTVAVKPFSYYCIFDMIQNLFYVFASCSASVFHIYCSFVKVKLGHLLFDLFALLTNPLVINTKTRAAQLMLLQMQF